MREVFDEGHVDVAIFQSTYLREWYKNGFNTTEQNGAPRREAPGQVPRQHAGSTRATATPGCASSRTNVEKWQPKGVKLYTAEWNGDSRGYKLTDPECYRFLERAQELGIKNIHVHKGPTIWPLDKDAFDVSDVDHAATDFQGLNFIVEHVGLPRIEDFCFMATQEPNVYAGPLGGHRRPHARPSRASSPRSWASCCSGSARTR